MRNHLWVVEEKWGSEWIGWDDRARPTRSRARRLQQRGRKEDSTVVTRIRKYVRTEQARHA